MKAQVSLITRRDLNVFVACLLSFALLMMPFVPVAAAASRGSERKARVSRDKSSPAQPQAVAANAPIPAPAPQPFAPVIAATKAAVLINDDGDAKASRHHCSIVRNYVTLNSDTGTEVPCTGRRPDGTCRGW